MPKPSHQWRKFTPEEIKTIVKLRKRGWSAASIANKLGCQKGTVRRFCKENNLERKGLVTFTLEEAG